MKRVALLVVVVCLNIVNLCAQMAIDQWRYHAAYHDATVCTTMGGRIYVVSDGSLYSYNPDDSFVDIYNKATNLSDRGIRYMVRCEAEDVLVLVYENANIDLLYPDEHVVNLPDFHEKNTLDPTVNDVIIHGSYAYLATNFGVVVVNIRKQEFANTYPAGTNLISVAANDDYILALTSEGVRCGKTSDNLLDASNWRLLCSNHFNKLGYFDGQFLGLSTVNGLYQVNLDGTVKKVFEGKNNHMAPIGKQLLLSAGNTAYIFDHLNTTPLKLTFDQEVNDVVYADKMWWAACGTNGLNGWTADEDGSLTPSVTDILPDSPRRNYCDYLSFTPNERLLVAGGCLDYFGTTTYPGTIEIFEDERWTNFEEEGIKAQTGLMGYSNITSVVQDPTDENHHYASAFGQGIYEFRDGKFVGNINSSNSALETVIAGNPSYTRIGELQYDKSGNLWITNCHAESPIKVLTTANELISLPYEELKKLPTITHILFDTNGLTWVIAMRADPGLFCIDDGGTPFNTADDRTKFVSPGFKDQDGNNTTLDYIYDITEDKTGTIWILTNHGPYVMHNPKEFFLSDFHFTKVKVPRNDGTNNADYLLDGVYTTCIAVDAADRKWIGTQSSGLYLISADGYETIHHFTAANSPLPSDNIKDIAIKGSTGEVFIGTDKGLVSFMGDATTPADSYEKSAVYAYPNPVDPDYEGVITIVGLKENSSVKVINTAGRLVAEGTSLGGSFGWSGKDESGKRVPTGVYFVLATDKEGKEGIATKILFIK